MDGSSADRSKARSSVVWSVVENGGLALLSFCSLIIYSRFLSASDFGLFSIVLALVELVGVVVGMLFHDALVQKEKVTDLHFDTAFTFTLVLGVVLAVACALFAPVFSHVVDDPKAGAVLAVTALCFPASALSATLVAEQRRKLEFRPLALRSLVGRMSGALVGIALVVLGAGFWGLVAQQVLIALTGSLVLWFAASSHPRLRFGKAEFGELFRFGRYSVGSLFLSFAVKRLFILLAGVMLGTEAAGYLNLSFRTVDVFWAISATAVNQVALPVFARLQSDPQKLEQTYRSALELACFALYPCFVGIGVTAPEVVEILFGHAWLPSVPYVVALAFLVLIQVPRLLVGPALTAVGRPRDSLLTTLCELAVMLLVIAAIGVPSLPVAVGIWAVREVVAAPVWFALLQRATGIRIATQLRATLGPFLASSTMAALVCGARWFLPLGGSALTRLLCLALIGVASFVAALWLWDRTAVLRLVELVASGRRARRPAPC